MMTKITQMPSTMTTTTETSCAFLCKGTCCSMFDNNDNNPDDNADDGSIAISGIIEQEYDPGAFLIVPVQDHSAANYEGMSAVNHESIDIMR